MFSLRALPGQAEDTLASQRQVGTIRAAVWEFN
jgi:hypothetical protein